MKICTSCVMPETAESLSFDNHGKCSACNQINYKKKSINWEERSKDLDKIISKFKNKSDYDCIVPFSGGKDSTFTLWYVVAVKKLKPLVVRYDHHFYRKNTEENNQKTLSKLNVDFLNFKSSFDLVKKTMKESLIRRGDFCWHCHVGIASYPIKVAIEKKIPLLIYGEPSSEYSSYHDYSEIEKLDEDKFNKTTNLGINAEDMFEMVFERNKNLKIEKKEFHPFIFPTQRELNQNEIHTLYLGNYIPWDVKKQVEIIKKELNWMEDNVEGIPEEYGYEKIECIMQGVRDYIKYLKRGFGRTAHLTSIDIRNSRMSRDRAIELTNLFDGKKPKTLDLFLKITNLTEKEFYDIVKEHVIFPSKNWDVEEERKKTSNITPSDFDNWINKEF